MWRSWPQMSTQNTAEPTKANQNGPVMPQRTAMSPPSAAPATIPPYTPSPLTLVTRPCSRPGTARWRTVTDVVLQMKACAPKTKNTAIATAGARW